ncbi:unnamed protein product [Linum tenue]|uniref:BHLH domain-containing protein n=1 Tax=Linum tenue TaxID=586396 RepID=A0AAV0LCQ5_9ROSI|nr:unnamed protein product [Linum tenue]
MELPQRPSFGGEGGRKPTHDFLSLYTSHSTTSLQDVSPRPPSSHQAQGGYLKTHDFLQPLERGGGPPCAAVAKEEGEGEEATPATSVEHTLPGGIGTYTINHVSHFNNPQTTTTVVDTNDETSNSTCYTGTGSGFTLWDETALNKGKTGKENKNIMTHTSNALLIGKQTEARPSTNYHSNHFSSLSPPQAAGHKRKSFMEMMKSTKVDEDLDDEEDFILKKESPGKVPAEDLNVRVDGKSCDQKANTPRSKHSATEQRRRSKINDRFHMLREIIPHSDQKRDKASFLLEVIEYIQFLHDKVHKYEQGSYQGWSLEAAKLVQWRSNNRTAESYVDQSRVTNEDANSSGLQYAPKLDDKNASISATIPGLGAQKPADSDTSSATTPKAMNHHHHHHSGIPNKAMPFPMSLQTNPLNPVRACSGTSAQPSLQVKTNIDSVTTQPQSQPGHFRPNGFVHAGDHLKDQDLNVEGGTISISSAYSRGFLGFEIWVWEWIMQATEQSHRSTTEFRSGLVTGQHLCTD